MPDLQLKCLRRLRAHRQLELRGSLDRTVAWPRALGDPLRETGELSPWLGNVRAIRHEKTFLGKPLQPTGRRHSQLHGRFTDALDVGNDESRGQHDNRLGPKVPALGERLPQRGNACPPRPPAPVASGPMRHTFQAGCATTIEVAATIATTETSVRRSVSASSCSILAPDARVRPQGEAREAHCSTSGETKGRASS